MFDSRDTVGPSPREVQALIRAEREEIPFLHWRDGEGEQRILMLPTDGERVTIGRRAGQSVSLQWDSEVSRIHALLDFTGDHWTLVDEGSSNGSYVNGSRISQRHRLVDRDRMCFGNTHVTYREPAPPEGAPSTTRAPATPTSIPLSPQHRKVLIALCRPVVVTRTATPATNRQIAEELYLSEEAVKAHLRLLFRRFGLEELPQNEKRARLADMVLASGMLAPHEF
jgi:pSer/pThr/pTyr-binding forkhead associated (FHA) protein